MQIQNPARGQDATHENWLPRLTCPSWSSPSPGMGHAQPLQQPVWVPHDPLSEEFPLKSNLNLCSFSLKPLLVGPYRLPVMVTLAYLGLLLQSTRLPTPFRWARRTLELGRPLLWGSGRLSGVVRIWWPYRVADLHSSNYFGMCSRHLKSNHLKCFDSFASKDIKYSEEISCPQISWFAVCIVGVCLRVKINTQLSTFASFLNTWGKVDMNPTHAKILPPLWGFVYC